MSPRHAVTNLCGQMSFATVMGPLVSHQLGTTCLGSASMVVGIFGAVN
jgi:hypothetical protein